MKTQDFIQLLKSQFVHLSQLAFQNKKFVEQSNIVFGLLVFSFSCPSMNSSTDESRLGFEDIFLKKNAPD